MNSFKMIAAALLLIFALSMTSAQAADKTKNTSGKTCTSDKSKACKTECDMHKDASGKEVKAECKMSGKEVKAECGTKTKGCCPSSGTGKATKLESKNTLKNNPATKEKAATATPNVK